jgi:hypothetical protein
MGRGWMARGTRDLGLRGKAFLRATRIRSWSPYESPLRCTHLRSTLGTKLRLSQNPWPNTMCRANLRNATGTYRSCREWSTVPFWNHRPNGAITVGRWQIRREASGGRKHQLGGSIEDNQEHIRPNESVLCDTRTQATRACSPGEQNRPTPPEESRGSDQESIRFP